MSRLRKFRWMILLALGCAYSPVQAQVVVTVRPAPPAAVVTRPAAPGPNYVWVEEDWRSRNGGYEWAGGHWVQAPYAGAAYRNGYWQQYGNGYRWVPGGWRKDNGNHTGWNKGNGNGHGKKKGHRK